LGAYVLGDYTETSVNHQFWQISPGVEALGKVFDFRANGYFPVGKKDYTTEGWADEFGNYNHIQYQGHNMYDAKFIYHEETGPGVDAEVGSKLFKFDHLLVKGYVGGYYFNMQHHDDVTGGSARLTFQATRAAELSLNDTYDNYNHNTFMLSLRLSIFDLFTKNRDKWVDENNLQPRLFDPIERNFSELASGSDAPITGAPGENKSNPDVIPPEPPTPTNQWYDHHGDNPERSNIWFFTSGEEESPGDLPTGNGTYETPYTGPAVYQSTIDSINSQTGGAVTYLYFTGKSTAGGFYSLNDDTAQHSGYLALNPNQSIWGRMDTPTDQHKGFSLPATSDVQPEFHGGFIMQSNTSAHNLKLFNFAPSDAKPTTGALDEGIKLENATGVTIDNVQVGTEAETDSDNAYQFGILLTNSSISIINSSKVYGFYSQGDSAGIVAQDKSNIYAYGYSIIKGTSSYGGAYGAGIYLFPDSSDNDTTMGTITGDGTAEFIGQGITKNGSSAFGAGLYAYNSGSITFGDIISSKFTGNSANNGFGLDAESYNNSITFGKISGSTFSGNVGNSSGYGFYVFNYQNGGTISTGSITDSKFNGSFRDIDLTASAKKITIASIDYNGVPGQQEASLLRSNLASAGNSFSSANSKICMKVFGTTTCSP
jgi:hypothetical protein